jgi:DNA polymerase-4
MQPAPRVILHLDMDAFYAAVEQRDCPELRGKPLLVGGDPRGRGVVSTASYEARPFGCRSALPMAQAVRLCPQAIIVPPRMSRYVEVSRQIFDILERYTPLIEPLSIDEAFMDVTGSQRLHGDGPTIAAALRRDIERDTGLTASVGVAPNKFLAKLASDLHKPDGLTIVPRDDVFGFLDPIPIARLWGAGKVTQPRLEAIGIRTFADLRRAARETLVAEFGEKTGDHFFRLARGDDARPVVCDRDAQSISHEITFAIDVTDADHLRSVLLSQVDQVARRLRRAGMTARTATMKLRKSDFTTLTRSCTLDAATDQTDVIWEAVALLFDAWTRDVARRSRERIPAVRLIGAGVSGLSTGGGAQLSLFDAPASRRRRRLDETVDHIRDRFGGGSLQRGANVHSDNVRGDRDE